MKKYFIALFLFSVSFNIFANTNFIIKKSTKAYHNAVIYFEKQEYGKALKYSEDAIQYRKEEIELEQKILRNALSPKRVQAAGENINEVLKVLESRKEFEAIKIIKSYYNINENTSYDDSISVLVNFIDSRKEFPEAQKLIGDIYKIEGEYEFAETYYMMSLKNENVLDIHNEKYDILYTLVEISKLQENYSQMEKRLLSILINDSHYNDKNFKKSIVSLIRQNKNDSLEKFLLLYRADDYVSIPAYNQLCEYYINQNEMDKALEICALSVITSFTKINLIFKDRDPDYDYINLEDFFSILENQQDVINWGIKNDVWKSFNTLADIANRLGINEFARDLLVVLAKGSPERYWQENAVLQLSILDE